MEAFERNPYVYQELIQPFDISWVDKNDMAL